ncbi:MAG TPA: MarR family winged helix-turn-helix transcriptional regulator [Ktedonosporobacter sp.]|nr:MarR family winged helix-turn-helix transcriptional regulator [Ktedonosporobacter sp.]
MTNLDNPQWKTPEDAKSSRESLIALQFLYEENELLYHQSSSIIENVYSHGAVSMGRRGVLLALYRHGPQTVPQIASEKSVSRQYIQKLVNRLVEEGYVELIDNAAHKRSHLVQLTEEGQAYMTRMRQREAEIVREMTIPFPAEQLQTAVETLRAVREWQKEELGRLLSAL